MTTTLFTLHFVLLVASVQAKATERSVEPRVTCYSLWNQMGRHSEFTNAATDLSPYHLGNTIESVGGLNGMWIFYDHVDYNSHKFGEVCWVYGIDFNGNFHHPCKNMAMSLRYAGSPYFINQDTWTVFDGTYFTGEVFHGFNDIPNMDYMSNRASSLILTGPSSWTFYTQPSYQGYGICLTTNTVHVIDGYQRLDLGIYEWFDFYQLLDNNIQSVRKGCFGERVIHPHRLGNVQRNANGLMGYIKP